MFPIIVSLALVHLASFYTMCGHVTVLQTFGRPSLVDMQDALTVLRGFYHYYWHVLIIALQPVIIQLK